MVRIPFAAVRNERPTDGRNHPINRARVLLGSAPDVAQICQRVKGYYDPIVGGSEQRQQRH